MKARLFSVLGSKWKVVLVILLATFALSSVSSAQVVIAQLSDTHLGEAHSPHAAENLRKAVEMINARRPDAVVLSGDIGENPQEWEKARDILKGLKAPLYYAPGNHDVHTHDVNKYREVLGKDYYTFRVKNVEFVVVDSQLLGNYEQYDAKTPPPLPPDTKAESDKMLAWLEELGKVHKPSGVVIGVQHIPVFRDGDFPRDSKPYWVINDPYRSQEMKALHDLGIKDMLVGHWHIGRVFEKDGITWHVAPATSWLPMGGELGFAMHSISPDGKVHTEFVNLPDARP